VTLVLIYSTYTSNEITMEYKQIKGNEIEGELDIFVSHNEDDEDGEITKWNEVLIYGDPEGLRSLAKLLIEIADLNQDEVEDKYLPIGEREHYHLTPNIELSKSSDRVIVGRLDAKGSGSFYNRYISKS
jgi:bisphosphoglycerate-dependent phosphoglycerate mutase